MQQCYHTLAADILSQTTSHTAACWSEQSGTLKRQHRDCSKRGARADAQTWADRLSAKGGL